jgi:hypothetical protein
MAVLIGLLIGYAISFLLNAGIVWLLCWGLKAIGITAIGGWTVAFSWPLVLIFTVIYMILRGIFSRHDKE